MRKLFLLLALIVAGVQSAKAFDYKGKVEYDKAEYYIYSSKSFMGDDFYSASLANITGTGDVVIPRSFEYTNWENGKLHFYGKAYVGAAGWWYDQQKAEDITCSADITSLLFEGAIEIHGHFKLQNLYGSLTFPNLSSGLVSTIASDATLDIPHVNAFNCNSLQVDGTILAPALPQLTLKSTTTVNGSITAANATQVTIGGIVNSTGVLHTPSATQVDITQGTHFYGIINAGAATKVNIASDTHVTGTVNVQNATRVIMDANSFYGTISSGQLSSITLGKTDFGTSGKLLGPLTDIYIPSKTALPTFYGNYYDHFTTPYGNITVHVYDMSTNEIAAMKNSSVWNGFTIVNHKTEVSYTLTNNSSATVSFYGMNDNDYLGATSFSQYAQVVNGSKTGTVKAESNYAVVITGIDFDTKDVTLKRNGSVVTLKSGADQGSPVRYYNDLDLQQNVSYEVSVSDKVCTLTFNQTGYTGRIMYQKTLNGTTSTGVITAYAPTVTCAQGSQLKLTIPYDQYTPNVLRLNGSTVSMTKANGEATATITVPAAATAEVDLTWQAPQQQDPPHHQPEIMIMRSGEGNILFKGLCAPEEQAQEAYEQQFGYPAEDGIVVSAVANCTNTVTTVTVPDYDYLGRGVGYTFETTEWGFRAEITPVAGQTLKTLLVGYIDEEDDRQTIVWEDLLYGENYGMYVHPEYRYVHYNESTNIYTLNWGFDEMNIWIGDYVVNIGLGPEETAVETGATLNFVRQGGRTEVLFEKEDVDGTLTDQVIGEGSMSFNLKYFTEAELDDAGMNYYQLLWFHPVEGETIHVFCDGTDITSQLIYNSETGNARLELERKNHTYTILIEDAPDANPTWSIHNATEGDVIVEQTLKDGTTTTTTYVGNLNDLVIDDTQVSKVTLKVYAENANESKPVRVLVNGQDVSYQFSTKQNDGDGFRLCYEVPVSELTNCSWDISYNTDRPQTFVVKGGTCNLLMEFYYENLENELVLDISPNDGPATVYLPPFNSEWNRYVTMTVNADEYEGLTIKRNGIDVTYYFTKTVQSNGKKYYELDIAEGDLEGNSTVGLLSFDIREAAVWEIVYKSIDEQETKFSIINHDQLALRAVRSYVTGGAPAIQPISQDHYEFSFNDADRENTSSYYLKVPIKDANYQYYPVRVLRNGVDVTFDDNFLDEFADDYLIYKVNMRVNETWDISRDTSHRQTFIRKGGTTTWNVEVEFDFPVDGDEKYFYPDQIGTPLYVDFPTYNSIYASYAYIFIDVEDGSTFSVLRNGVDVTDKFSLVTGSAGASAGFERYCLDESDYDANNDGMTPGLGFTFRDPAVWQITIGDTDRYDVNRDGKISIADVTKLVNQILGKE